MLKYRQGLADRPSYDMDTNEYRITLNANESTMNLPPIVEDRLMGGLRASRSTAIRAPRTI